MERQPLLALQALGFHLDVKPHFVVHLGGDAIPRVRVRQYAPIRAATRLPRCFISGILS